MLQMNTFDAFAAEDELNRRTNLGEQKLFKGQGKKKKPSTNQLKAEMPVKNSSKGFSSGSNPRIAFGGTLAEGIRGVQPQASSAQTARAGLGQGSRLSRNN